MRRRVDALVEQALDPLPTANVLPRQVREVPEADAGRRLTMPDVPDRELTSTSFVVLGLLQDDPGTPYDLKARVAAGLGNFWPVQHAQLYTETSRLAAEGLLTETRESEGRRRKMYRITTTGKKALREWLRVPVRELTETRDLALVKLFFGADPKLFAAEQEALHRAKLKQFESIKELFRSVGGPRGPRLTLEVGIAHEREWVKFWAGLS